MSVTPEERAQADRKILRASKQLRDRLPGWSNILILSSYGETGTVIMRATASKADTIRLLRELADNLEQQGPAGAAVAP